MAHEIIRVDCLRGFDEVDRERWDALWQSDPHATFYQKYDWYAAWVRHFAPEAHPFILIASQSGRWLGAAALTVRIQAPLPLVSRKVLTFISSFSPAYPLYQGPLVDPGHEAEAIDALGRAIAGLRGFCAVNFELYDADSPAEKLLRAVARTTGKPLRQWTAANGHRIQWSGDYEAYIKSLGSRTRRNIRNYSRQFFEAGEDHYLQQVDSGAEISALIEAIRQQKQRRFQARGHQSNFDRDFFTDFLMDLAPRACEEGNALGLIARIGERIIGAQLIFLDEHGHFFSYNSSFDQDYKDLRIHYLLESERVRLALGRGYALIDLSTGNDAHKRHWTGGKVRPLIEGEVVPRPLGNARYGAFSRLKNAIKSRSARMKTGLAE